MADYQILKEAVAAVIKDNEKNEITGDLLQATLLTMINSLGSGYQFAGVADGAVVPGTPDAKLFYIAGPGTYINFGGLVVNEGELAIFFIPEGSGGWYKQAVPVGDHFNNKSVLDLFTSLNGKVLWDQKEIAFDSVEWLEKYTINRLTGALINTNNASYALSDYIYLNDFSGILFLKCEYGNYANDVGLALFSSPHPESLIQIPFFQLRTTNEMAFYVPENAKFIRITKHAIRIPYPKISYNIQTAEESILQAVPIPLTKGVRLNMPNSLAVGDTFVFAYSPADSYGCAIIPVNEGDVFTLNATSASKIYAIIDSLNIVLDTNSPSGAGTLFQNKEITIPANGKYLCLHSELGFGLCYKGRNNAGILSIWQGDEVSFRQQENPKINALYVNKTNGRLLSIEDRNIVNPRVRQFINEIDYSFDLTNYTQSFVSFFKIYESPNIGDFPLPSFIKIQAAINYAGSGHFKLYDETGNNIVDETMSLRLGKVLTFWNLEPDHIYTWFYTNASGSTIYDKGVIVPRGYPRFVKIMDSDIANRVDNVRDLGGWPVGYDKKTRYGLLFRGSDMNIDHVINEAGIDVMLNVLHIGFDLDLRSSGESPIDHSPLGNTVSWARFPVTAYTITGTSGTYYANAIKQIVANLNNGIITYFHCKAGADRTGTLSFLILGILGVNESDLNKEYECTNGRNRNTLGSDNRDIPHLVASIKNYNGSSFQEQIINWAIDFGVTAQEIADLQSKMIKAKNI